ncbi:protein RALF-like protein 34 [Cinnamomum micranthum f. kanehirae]|uniref:Protein RALF-like protein 34 n=1 Tax=Cinnamomum micranthum f. kanehirae TaxID=337451 RepID=A0A443NUC4_9MAGN|nr:protein RALF-like protein 34 [Cinnamomum micranthum f. kanehirae]
MAANPLWKVIFSLVLFSILCTQRARSQVEGMGSQLMSDALEWPSTPSIYDLDDVGDDDMDVEDGGMSRRSLYWRRHYFISYGALSANRIPCPPRSGRSYYTHNCYKQRGPAHPYVRGCSAITRCRRDVY